MSRPINADALERDAKGVMDRLQNEIRIASDILQRIIKVQPTIMPERRKGMWIPQEMNNDMASILGFSLPKCSECGKIGYYANFCPNCGADMRNTNDD